MDSVALALTLIAFGVLLIALSYQRHRHHRDVSAVLHGVSGAGLAVGGMVLLTLTFNFDTYDTLRPDQPLAELTVERANPKTFSIRLMRIPAGDLQVFALNGDHWQVDARLLTWQGWSRWLGLSANIRLEKLNGSDDSTTPPTATGSYLLNRTPGLRLVALQQRFPRLLDFLTSQSVQTAHFPLQDGARFHLYFSDGQLLARAINQPKVAQRIEAKARVKPNPPVNGNPAESDDDGDIDADASPEDLRPRPAAAAGVAADEGR